MAALAISAICRIEAGNELVHETADGLLILRGQIAGSRHQERCHRGGGFLERRGAIGIRVGRERVCSMGQIAGRVVGHDGVDTRDLGSDFSFHGCGVRGRHE